MAAHDSLFDVRRCLRQAAKTPAEERGFVDRLNNLKLLPLEEFLLTRLYQPRSSSFGITLDRYEKVVPMLRGQNGTIQPWLNEAAFKDMFLTEEMLEDPAFIATVLHSLYVWHTGDFHLPAIRFLRMLETFTTGDFLFDGLVKDVASLYRRISLLIFVQFFGDLPTPFQLLFANSALVFGAIARGLDVDQAFARAVQYSLMVINRREMCLRLAAFLYENKTPLGKQPGGVAGATIAFWIEQFDLFSQKKFDGISLINFLQDRVRWQFVSAEEKYLVEQGITLYAHLISDHYVLPDFEGPLSSRSAPARVTPAPLSSTQVSEPKRAEGPALDWQKILAAGVLDDALAAQVAVWLKRNSAESARSMIFSAVKDKKWQDEPLLNVLLGIDALFEDCYGPAIQPLLYFDEIAGTFVWNKV